MRIILGVDAGNSKTYAVVVDEDGNRLGTGVAGEGNHQAIGIDGALANIREAAFTALETASLAPSDVTFVQYGLAGADRERDFNILRPALATLPFREWDVVCDTLEGLRTGSPDNVGVVLVCGSGANAMGRSRDGKMVQTGGFDDIFGDRSGGGFLSKETFSAAFRSWEGREQPSLLPDMVAHYLGFVSIEEVFNHYLDHDIRHVPRNLAIVLHDAAKAGDALAIRILTDMGRELGLSANSVIQRLGGFGETSFPVVVVGSVIQKGRSPHVLGTLEETVRAVHPAAYFVIPEMAPVYGSIMLAMDQLGIQVPDTMVQKFISFGGYAQ